MAEFVAEISSNHNGDLVRCRHLIRAAADCGCSAVKFQLFRIDELFAPEILRVSREHRLRRRWELPVRFVSELAACAREAGLKFGCSPFHLAAVGQLADQVDFLKIASYELTWPALIRACAATGLPLMLSTGMADATEIRQAAATAVDAGCLDLTVLHCVSRYPVPPEQCNLAAMGSVRTMLADEFPDRRIAVGWSDHSVDPGVIERAVRHWRADPVEFHFDLEGAGAEFGGGHCWLPDQIGPVIATAEQTVSESGFPIGADSCDGDGVLQPRDGESQERSWRADPVDGLRPTRTVRDRWPAQQPGARTAGPGVVLVADGLGLGHLSRCVALAEALRDTHDADCSFVIRGTPDQTRFLVRNGFGWQVASADDPATWRDEVLSATENADPAPAFCVIDLDRPASELASALGRQGRPVVVVDQPMASAADLIIVPSLSWQAPADRTDLIGGPETLLLRDDVVRLRPEQSPEIGGRDLVISFGGSDPHNLTERAADALAPLANDTSYCAHAIMGPGFADRGARATALRSHHPQLKVHTAGDPLEGLLTRAALLVTALGVTVAEALALGVPVAVLYNWPADAEVAAELARIGAVANLGLHTDCDALQLQENLESLLLAPFARQLMATAGWQLVDGRGAWRSADWIVRRLEGGPC